MYGIAQLEVFPNGNVRRMELSVSPFVDRDQAERVVSRMNLREQAHGSGIEYVVYPKRPIIIV